MTATNSDSNVGKHDFSKPTDDQLSRLLKSSIAETENKKKLASIAQDDLEIACGLLKKLCWVMEGQFESDESVHSAEELKDYLDAAKFLSVRGRNDFGMIRRMQERYDQL